VENLTNNLESHLPRFLRTHMTLSDIIQVPITSSELAFLKRHAKRAELGGRSNIRGADRQATLGRDQLIGMVGAFAGTKLFGDVRLFRLQRFFADLYPAIGDGGSDIPGANVDFKSSAILNKNKDLLSYRLAVRPKERHPDMNYVLCLCELEPVPVVYLVGWASESMLPTETEADGPFAGAYTLPASQLHPLMRLTWFAEKPLEFAATAAATTEVNAEHIQW
jgi:hypothetical protein